MWEEVRLIVRGDLVAVAETAAALQRRLGLDVRVERRGAEEMELTMLVGLTEEVDADAGLPAPQGYPRLIADNTVTGMERLKLLAAQQDMVSALAKRRP